MICFQCGGGLKDWNKADDPNVEHANWFKDCPYLIQVKGREFIEGVQQMKFVQQYQVRLFFPLNPLNMYKKLFMIFFLYLFQEMDTTVSEYACQVQLPQKYIYFFFILIILIFSFLYFFM